jgi:hypothetical protein
LILLLRIFTALFTLTPFGNPPESIASGNYDTPPRTWWWFKQSIIYFMGLMGMKICVLIIFIIAPWISRVGDWALRWTEGNEALQVVFVMLIFPVIMNATQYYIIDSFIKNQTPGHEVISDEDDDSDDSFDDPYSGVMDDSEEEENDPEVISKAVSGKEAGGGGRGGGSGNQILPKSDNLDYDPLLDGEGSPTVIGSANSLNAGARSRHASEGDVKGVGL